MSKLGKLHRGNHLNTSDYLGTLFLEELQFRDLGFGIGHTFQAFLVEDNSDRQINMAPKNVCIPVPRTCEYIMLHGMEEFKVVYEIKIINRLTLTWGNYSGLSL